MAGGYRLASVDRSKVDVKDLCPKCEGLLREPVQTIACGHRYCRTCVDVILSEGAKRCVVDGSVIKREEVFLDKFIEREIQSREVHCVNHDEGCKWKDELRKREEHDAVCELGKVPCVHPGCGELVTRAELVEHLERKCNYRLEKCEFCQTPVLFAAMKDHHENQCPSNLVSCTECGRKDIPRVQVSAHMDPVTGDCEEVQAACPLVQIGCPETKVMKLKERRLHEEKCSPGHVALLFRIVMQLSSAVVERTKGKQTNSHANGTLLPLQREIEQSMKHVEKVAKENRELKSKVQQQDERIRHLERTRTEEPTPGSSSTQESGLKELSRRMNNEEAKTADLEVFIVEGNRLNEDLQRQVATVQRENKASQDTIRQLQRQLESMEHTMALRNMALADLEENIRQQEVSSHNGILIWKLSDFARRKRDAVTGKQASIYSPLFYTSHHGYKLCARIYLNGDGMGKGTHISVFFVVMRGQYDGLLRWPFRQKVTMMLLDQDNVEHVIDAFRPDPNSSSFQKPRREMNVASGCPTFFPQSELNTHAYVRDDTMFLKIIVDTSDL